MVKKKKQGLDVQKLWSHRGFSVREKCMQNNGTRRNTNRQQNKIKENEFIGKKNTNRETTEQE